MVLNRCWRRRIAGLAMVYRWLRWTTVEAHVSLLVHIGLGWNSRVRSPGRHVVRTGTGRMGPPEVRQCVVTRIGLHHRFPMGIVGKLGVSRRVWRERLLPVILHWRVPFGFMMSSVVDRC